MIIGMDYPDPDVIRVEDTYYMVSTTMYFMPGCVILRSYNLKDWEIVTYVYDELEPTPKECLQGEHAYGQGMWAASLRYHQGTFYICFVSNDTGKTYLFTSKDVMGPWKRGEIQGFYHDCSMLFDDDGKVYLAYGNRQIYLTELNDDLSAPREGGINQIIVEDKDEVRLGYEGTHFYKINGKYYLFFIHWKREEEAMRSQVCYVADSVTGPYRGEEVLNDDGGYCHQGIAQGGIVSSPQGEWYAVLFRDSGAVGRIPVLVPVTWKQNFPVFGVNGKVPENVITTDLRPGYSYAPLYGDEEFTDGFAKYWQWNHIPQKELWKVNSEKKALCLTSGQLCANPVQAINTLTQRFVYPGSEFEVHVDGNNMKDGDIAGLCLLQGDYVMLGIEKENSNYYLSLIARKELKDNAMCQPYDETVPMEKVKMLWSDSEITIKVQTDFTHMRDKAQFFVQMQGEWKPVGDEQDVYFKLDHFCGVRAGLCYYGKKETGGMAEFSHVRHRRRE